MPLLAEDLEKIKPMTQARAVSVLERERESSKSRC
ncbi:DUF2947 domain-containing protein [Vibrio chagasii]|nr:DUF2947 domain-containing protein [Vibrio chagasii]